MVTRKENCFDVPYIDRLIVQEVMMIMERLLPPQPDRPVDSYLELLNPNDISYLKIRNYEDILDEAKGFMTGNGTHDAAVIEMLSKKYIDRSDCDTFVDDLYCWLAKSQGGESVDYKSAMHSEMSAIDKSVDDVLVLLRQGEMECAMNMMDRVMIGLNYIFSFENFRMLDFSNPLELFIYKRIYNEKRMILYSEFPLYRYWMIYGDMLMKNRRFADAAKAYDRANILNPVSFDSLIGMSDAFYWLRNYSSYEEYVWNAWKIAYTREQVAQCTLGFGNVFFEKYDYQFAAQMYQLSNRIYPTERASGLLKFMLGAGMASQDKLSLDYYHLRDSCMERRIPLGPYHDMIQTLRHFVAFTSRDFPSMSQLVQECVQELEAIRNGVWSKDDFMSSVDHGEEDEMNPD